MVWEASDPVTQSLNYHSIIISLQKKLNYWRTSLSQVIWLFCKSSFVSREAACARARACSARAGME